VELDRVSAGHGGTRGHEDAALHGYQHAVTQGPHAAAVHGIHGLHQLIRVDAERHRLRGRTGERLRCGRGNRFDQTELHPDGRGQLQKTPLRPAALSRTNDRSCRLPDEAVPERGWRHGLIRVFRDVTVYFRVPLFEGANKEVTYLYVTGTGS